MNLLFILDIGINFRTTYINTKTGNEVSLPLPKCTSLSNICFLFALTPQIYEPRKIAKRYLLGGRFWIDLISSLPLDSFQSGGSSDVLGVFSMLKLVRITRISKIISNLNIKQEMKSVSFCSDKSCRR